MGPRITVSMPRAIILNSSDNVATLIDPGTAGDQLTIQGAAQPDTTLKSDIPYGHKCAIRPIGEGEHICKYGEIVGQASCSIEAGEHVHVHNVDSLRARGDLGAES